MNPLLSVVVAIVSDTVDSRSAATSLAGCLEALLGQRDGPATEIIVPYHEGVGAVEALRGRFPSVIFHRVEGGPAGRASREHHDALRARGLALSRGELVGLIEDHGRPAPDWARAMTAAHRQGWAGVGGAIDNGVDHALSWAVYFCDFSRYQPPVADGEVAAASDANVTYKRAALEAIRADWETAFREPAVNAALRARGEKLALSGRAVVHQHRRDLRLAPALRERFVWGRSYAAARRASGGRRLAYTIGSAVLPALLLIRMTRTVLGKGRGRRAFLRALPLTALLTVSWSLGELVGYATGRGAGAAAMGSVRAVAGTAKTTERA
jgi:hypothetical protein